MTHRPLAAPARIGYSRVKSLPNLRFLVELITNPALIAIAVFIAAIFILNIVEFGRPD